MPVSSTRHALPRDRRMFVVDQPNFGTLVQPAASDGIRILTGGIDSHVINRIEIDDNRDTRSLEGQITGSIPPVPWSIESYLIPSGVAGTPPDIHQLLLKTFGAYVNTPATSDVYSPSDTQGDLGQLSIHEAMGRVGPVGDLGYVVSESLSGCWVETMGIKAAGGDPPMISFSGMGSRYNLTGRSILQSSPAASTTFTVKDPENFKVGSLIGIYASADGVTVVDDNGGAGILVTNVTGTTLTVSPAVTATVTDIAAPLAVVPTLAGDPLPGIVGSLLLDSAVIPVTSWELNYTNGLIPHADEAFQQNVTGYHEDKRRVTGTMTLRASADQIQLLGQRDQLGTHPLVMTIGNTAGRTVTVNVPKAEYEFNPLDKGGDVGIITLPFKALGTGDEMSITFT